MAVRTNGNRDRRSAKPGRETNGRSGKTSNTGQVTSRSTGSRAGMSGNRYLVPMDAATGGMMPAPDDQMMRRQRLLRANVETGNSPGGPMRAMRGLMN